MRSEGFPFLVGGLGVGAVFAWLVSRRRLSSFASLVVCRRRRVSNSRPLGEAFGVGFGWKRDVSDSCEIARNRVEM